MDDGDGGEIRRAAEAHGETEDQVLNRNFVEMLQELRVAQTGVQILFAFLLSIAFTNRFHEATSLERVIYLTTLVLCSMATGLLIAPAAFHRLLFRQRRRRELVEAANRLAIGGIFLLLLAMVGSVLLVVHFLVGGPAAWLVAGFVTGWLAVFWIVLPLVQRTRARRGSPSPAGPQPGDDGADQRPERARGSAQEKRDEEEEQPHGDGDDYRRRHD